jgi:hypothetical protein
MDGGLPIRPTWDFLIWIQHVFLQLLGEPESIQHFKLAISAAASGPPVGIVFSTTHRWLIRALCADICA